jgi:hypothetical protein
MTTLRIQIGSVRPDLIAHLEKSVESVPHVQAAHFEPGSSTLLLEHDGANIEEIAAAVREEGFNASF